MNEAPLTPKEIFEDQSISTTAKAIYGVLLVRPGGVTKVDLSSATGLSEKSIERNLGYLWKTRAVTFEAFKGGRGRHNLYRLTTLHRLQRDPMESWGSDIPITSRSDDDVTVVTNIEDSVDAQGSETSTLVSSLNVGHETSTLMSDFSADSKETSTLVSSLNVHGSETSTLVSSLNVQQDQDEFLADMTKAAENTQKRLKKTPPPKKRSKAEEIILRSSQNEQLKNMSLSATLPKSSAARRLQFLGTPPKGEYIENNIQIRSNNINKENIYIYINNKKAGAGGRAGARMRVADSMPTFDAGLSNRIEIKEDQLKEDQPSCWLHVWMGVQEPAVAGSAWGELIHELMQTQGSEGGCEGGTGHFGEGTPGDDIRCDVCRKTHQQRRSTTSEDSRALGDKLCSCSSAHPGTGTNNILGDKSGSITSRTIGLHEHFDEKSKKDHKTQKTKVHQREHKMGSKRLTKMQERVALAKKVAAKKASGQKLKGKIDPVTAMAYAYEEVYSEYLHKPAMKYITKGRLDHSNRSTKHFEQASKIADSLRIDYVDFVRAQFYWMHEWFARPCRTYELRSRFGGFPAKDRYMQHRKLISSGAAPEKVSSKSVGVATVSGLDLDEINVARVNRLMKLWSMNEDQVFITFAPEGIFDKSWLITNPAYRHLAEEGKTG